MWRQNKPEGLGTYTNEDGENIIGIWDHGKFTFSNNDQFQLILKDGKKVLWGEIDEEKKTKLLEITLS